MKLTTFATSLLVAGVLVGCSQTSNSQAKVAQTMTEPTSSAPALVPAAYRCDVHGKRKVVSATYEFVGGATESVTLTIDGKVVGDLKLDKSYEDGVRFVAGNGKRVWSLDSGFSQKTLETTVPVQYRSNDKIVAKNCEIIK
ncbi:hypothetical protein GVX81_01770 [[Haemophilus] felis]|uniref:C-type lysozyme inhibitor domain-containing protein n=1 Tax=[Haemophilus] felis TaxID=123822 RepID=A0A1T0BBH3_9PAST|nr:hypothetical protein [[Haemophilus] felis]NBI39995.1 hypothetical protein [[Haemophilus] felis]OOS07603.1 hypothetical protein B0188_00580 [[Haemophilus] felis]